MKKNHALLVPLAILLGTLPFIRDVPRPQEPLSSLPSRSDKVRPTEASPAAEVKATAASGRARSADLQACAEFSEWTQRYLEAQQASEAEGSRIPVDLLAEGRQLAEARRPAMLRLIQENPWRALPESVAWHEWVALPESFKSLVEEPFSAVADYSLSSSCHGQHEVSPGGTLSRSLTIDGTFTTAHVYGRRASMLSKNAIPVQGIRLDDEVALWESPVQVLDPVDHEAVKSLFPVGATDESLVDATPLDDANRMPVLHGGRIEYFASSEEVKTYARSVATLEHRLGPNTVRRSFLSNRGGDPERDPTVITPGNGIADTSDWAITPKTNLVLRVVFSGQSIDDHPYSQEALVDAYQAVSDVLVEHSYGKTHLITEVAGQVLTLPQTGAYYGKGGNQARVLHADARDAAEEAGLKPDDFDLIAIWFSELKGQPPFFGAGSAYADIGGYFSTYNGSFQRGGSDNKDSVIIHELGHNYGLTHANAWDGYTGTGFFSRTQLGEHEEYGDVHDIMGNNSGFLNGVPVHPNGHYSMSGKSFLGWINPEEVHDTEVSGSGVYRVHRYDHPDAPGDDRNLALRAVTANGDVIWAGYRRNFTGTKSLSNGAYIVWVDDPTGNSHRLIDTTPLSAWKARLRDDRGDAALTVGKTWVDPSRTLRITTLAVGGTAPHEYIDLQVSLAEPANLDLFTDEEEQTKGLVGSYVDKSLRAVCEIEDWRESQTIAGTRIDESLVFGRPDWGDRASLNLTGGTEDDWDHFSVQWDGFLRVRRVSRLATLSDDGSQMWIDLNHNGNFDHPEEHIDNGWGRGHDRELGDPSPPLDPGLYRIRIQYEEGEAGERFSRWADNIFHLLSGESLFEIYTDDSLTEFGLTGSYLNDSYPSSEDTDWTDGTPAPPAGTRVDLYPLFKNNGWGKRSELNLTGGSDNNWNRFSVQWDGVVRTGDVPIQFVTVSDDGSRLWIDLDGDGAFGSDYPEYVTTNWKYSSSGMQIGSHSGAAPANSTTKIRMQYEEGDGANNFRLFGVRSDDVDDHSDTVDFATILKDPATSLTGSIDREGDEDHFQLTLTESGYLRVFTQGSLVATGSLLDSEGNVIPVNHSPEGSAGSHVVSAAELPVGTYVIRVQGSGETTNGTYELTTELVAAGLPRLSDFNRDPATGDASVIIQGPPFATYRLVEASDLDFSDPAMEAIPLSAVTVGSPNGSNVTADSNGKATVQFNLGITSASTFIRAETVER